MPRKKTTSKEVYTLYIPKGAAAIIDEIVDTDPVYKEKQVWKYKYLRALSSLVERSQERDNEFVPVSISFQAGRLKCSNKHCLTIYRNLVNSGLVLVDKTTCRIKEHSFEYKPVYELLEAVKIQAAETDKKTREMLSEDRRLMEEQIQRDEVLKKYFEMMKKVSFCGKARFYFSNTISYSLSIPPIYPSLSSYNIPYTYLSPPLHGNFVPVSEMETFNRNLVAVDRIINGDIRVTRPDKESRIYTNITNLKRNFRKYLRLDGKPLIGLDIANSQPLIAAVLFRRFSENKYGCIRPDVQAYQRLCESGLFYDWFMELNGKKKEERQEFKADFFASVFFMKEYPKPGKLKRQFIEAFPTCNEALVSFKGGYMTKKDKYSQFSIAMQKVEAALVVGVNIRLIDMGIPALNIFDSLYVTSDEHYEIAERMLKEAFKEVGLEPNVKCEDYREL